jgi:hypothetical protein
MLPNNTWEIYSGHQMTLVKAIGWATIRSLCSMMEQRHVRNDKTANTTTKSHQFAPGDCL